MKSKRIKIQIKDWLNGSVLFEYEVEDNTIKKTVEKAVKLGVSLNNAKLNNAELNNAELNNAELNNAKLNNAELNNAELNNAELNRAELNNAELNNAKLNNAELNNAELNRAELNNAELNDAKLNDAKLNNAELNNAELNRAELNDAKLNDAKLNRAELNNAELNNAKLNNAELSQSKGLLNPIEYLESAFQKTKHGYVAYKTFSHVYQPPKDWKIEVGSIINEVANPIRSNDCGCGVNVGTLDWVKENAWNKGKNIWKCLIRWEWLAGVVVPYHTSGKIRASRVELIEIVKE